MIKISAYPENESRFPSDAFLLKHFIAFLPIACGKKFARFGKDDLPTIIHRLYFTQLKTNGAPSFDNRTCYVHSTIKWLQITYNLIV